MRVIILGIILFLLSLFTPSVFALEPPDLINPINGSTIASPTLNWQTPAYPLYSKGSPYRIQVDDDNSFALANKDRYKTTTSYSPEDLSEGVWYWRVKAKDQTGTWSEWSNIWSFILSSSTPSPLPTPSTSPTSFPTPSPTATPAPSPTPQPISSFTISNIPSQISSNQSFIASVSLTLPNNKNTIYYLTGAFKKSDGTRYFGLTKKDSNWIKYGDAASTQYQITTNSSGNWTETLEVKPDTSDSDYKGSGDYLFKVGRYTSSSSSPVWSNEIALKINDVDTSPNTPTPQPTSINNSEASPLPTKLLSSRSKPTQLKSLYQIASVAAATISAKSTIPPTRVDIKNQTQINPFILLGSIFIFAGIGILGYIYLRKNAKIPI